MKLLFIGDIVGSSGRAILQEKLSFLKEKYAVDCVIVNGENAAHGKGITRRIYNQIKNLGVDAITMGNHTFSKGELLDFIDEADILVRPMNLTPVNKGKAVFEFDVCGKKLAVVNLCGQVFMDRIERSPFECMDEVLNTTDADMIFVDFHGETTSEKITFAHVYGKYCIGICGTHTHVQTADERIVDGCGFISDAGMCGTWDSVLGRDKNEVIRHLVYHEPTRYTIAEGPAVLCGVVIDIDDETLRATQIERIQIRP